ncbi:hypothetical protein PHSY_005367 [Pseudozyma hubeiensis SY62]|uniref:UBA domain-containing protein n=1 Tax=Pseudozyma hubeiensis (strain SY62) TaxID=1305764 RepID=R9PI63_PSEHS|nr:hypothetical protein PHSY_005367 [Pseudozyma hubeiensis SY62]GAC97780.1 hypothetical protein PHSY_005367 [Pseudozyma hubeiensis SY62]
MDDLLDLSWQPTTAKAQSNQSSSSSSSSSARNIIPNFGSTSTRPNYYGSSSSSSPSKQSSSPAVLKPATSDDAFSSLFSSSSAKQQANLSLAERQRLAAEQARKKIEDDKRRNEALWSGIESSGFGGGSSSSVKTPSIPAPQRVTSPPSNSTASNKNKAADPWGFDAFSSAVPAPKASASTKSAAPPAKPAPTRTNDPFDFDSFDQSFSSAPSVAVHASNDPDDILGALAMPVSDAPKRSLSAADPRIASLSTSAATSSAGSSRVPSPASGSRPTANRSTPAKTGSPPPHVLGQIVEMGFSLQQAKQALARTDTGVNVEAALELLVGNNGASRHVHDDDERLARKLQAKEQRHAQSSFRDSDDEQDDYELERQRRRSQRERQQSNNDSRAPRRPQADGGASSNLDHEAAADWQQQADQLYAQASEIGSSVLTKASAFWSSAKAQAQKALDERNRAAAGADRSNTPSDAGSERHRARRWGASSAASKNKEWSGKPKWMVDAELAEADGTGSNDAASRDERPNRSDDQPAQVGGFKDSDNEDYAAAPELPTRATRRPAAPVASAAPAASVAAAATAVSSAASALWGNTKAQDIDQPPPSLPARSSAAATASASKTGYVSPNRRATPSRSAAPSPIPPKAPLKRRPIPSDASHSISSANRNKQEGNEHFKRGAYADAEASYTRGISALESSSSDSVRLVPLLSNRANVRLKNGDATGTIADCDQLLSIVLSLFGGSQRDASGRIAVYRASQEAGLPAELAEVNLRETYGKALVRRAQALETKERWKLAKADWEVLLEYEKVEGSGVKTAASNMRFAREGLFRCGKMLGEKVVGSAVSTAPIKKSSTTAGGGEKASEAFATQQAAQAAEESARFALKDSVDAKIEAWKKGKEGNLRALLTSLDTIVWEGLGWKPIGLNQVLDEGGLKKNYTKAIARLHPDKVKRGATVEQQMIAGAAFHVLNEAWNAKQG